MAQDLPVAPARGRRVLVIAGSDSSGGAGIAHDIATLHALGGRSAIAITALTAQSSEEVRGIEYVSPAMVRAQIEAAACDSVDAVKVGMLGTRPLVRAVAEALRNLRDVAPTLPIVVDPVLRSSSGASLLETDARDVLCTELLPLASVVTPNALEFAELLEAFDLAADVDAARATRTLTDRCGCPVLRKGGHDDGKRCVDHLAAGDDSFSFQAPRIAADMRGTGCALSTALALHLAMGAPLPRACTYAKAHVAMLLRAVAADRSLSATGS